MFLTSNPAPASLTDVLQSRATHQPDAIAYTFLVNGEHDTRHITYAELDARARAVAARLQETQTTRTRAVLLYPPGLDYIAAFFGCLYAGFAAVPAYPPRPNQHADRLRSIITDADAGVILASDSIVQALERRSSELLTLARVQWITTDTLAAAPSDWTTTPARSETLAFLQYTSGSTASPKGVMLTHGNLLHNLEAIRTALALRPDDRAVTWLPPYHDMGLIGNLLGSVYQGIEMVILSPVHFLQRPARWLQAISNYGATISGGPDFAYNLCLRKVTDEQRDALDLSRWRLAFNGAEPVRPSTLDRFADRFASCGFERKAFFPCYGLAESTLLVTSPDPEALPTVHAFAAEALEQRRAIVQDESTTDAVRDLVGCGRPPAGHEVVIADPETHERCSAGQVGEIWVKGPSVAQGYWNREDESRTTFDAVPMGTAPDGSFMRTGDLGFLQNGELFVTGRCKDLIILRGRNLYPQDIEQTVEHSHPALRPGCCAAFALEDGRTEHLAVVVEIERSARRTLDVEEVLLTVRQAVAETHQVPLSRLALLVPGGIPKTSSGKIRRHACRTGFQNGTLRLLAA